MAKMITVRVLLSVAINQRWFLYQMDVRNTFLHEDLKEEVFMKLPPGLSDILKVKTLCWFTSFTNLSMA